MTGPEMQVEFERRLHLISPDTIIDNKPTSSTIFSFLNAAQDRFCILNYVGDDQTVSDTNVFTKNVDALKSLVVEKRLTQSGVTPAGYPRFRLPYENKDEYFLYITSQSEVRGTYKQYHNTVRLNNKLVKYGDLQKYVETAINKPIVRDIAVAFKSDADTKYNYLAVVGDKYTTFEGIILLYYRRPRRFGLANTETTVNKCELPDTVHSEIVDLAIDMFITEAKYRLNIKPSNNNSND